MNSFNQITSFPILLHFLVYLLITITLCPLSSDACHEEERRALLNFKSFLDDPANRLSSWQESVQHRNCCAWHGIQCSDESLHVVSINLRNTKLEDYINEFSGYYEDFNPPSTTLQGKLSPSLVSINHLEYLDLAFNDFQESEIPFRFSELMKLTHLDLSYTNLSTSIATPFTNASSLQYLDLSCPPVDYFYTVSCFESQSTKWMKGLVNLQVLRLSGVDLSKATSSKENFAQHISYLSDLRNLDLSGCDISGPVFPIHEFQNLSRLSTLKMRRNFNFNSSVPFQIANLTSLSILDLSQCDLQGSIPNLPQLKELDVSVNYDLHIDVTRMFEHPWPKLQTFQISYTNATGSFPNSISKSPLLVSLSALRCSIQGSLPSSICEIFPLRDLNLGANKITGSVPSCITNLRKLSYFDVSGNSIGGKVSLFSLINKPDLTILDLSRNKLTVVLDDQHLQPSKSKLKYLFLHSCNMEGYIPTFFCNFTQLEDLDMSSNNLTGAIPSCISKLKKLNSLKLSKNRLRAPLPLLPPGVSYIDISNNKLSGLIPSSLCPQTPGFSRYRINLSHNKLSGIIPSSIGYCKYLNFLDLSNNNLNGSFPMFIHKLSSLKFLFLGNNNFEGTIPTDLGSLSDLMILSLRSNRFRGFIPEEILHLQQLRILDLSSNDFSGSIPLKLGNLTSLKSGHDSNDSGFYIVEYPLAIKGTTPQFNQFHLYNSGIDLSCNNLSGNIPEDIGLLQGLGMLNLSHNLFSNNIPASIGNMSSLESLDLSSNRLSGPIPQSLTLIDTLGVLNLSHNNLIGRIPRGNHFDTLSVNGSAFTENDLLCGFPIEKDCEGDHNIDPSTVDEDGREDAKEKFLLYAIVAMGVAVGFWGLFFVLLLRKQKWWYPYWRIVDCVAVKLVEG